MYLREIDQNSHHDLLSYQDDTPNINATGNS